MVNYLQAVILAIIQGITEWLPISSSGHLALTQMLLGISPPLFFDIALHIGTLIAVLIYFRNDILQLFRGFLTFDKNNIYFRYCLFILLASIPTAIIGFTLKDFFASMFTNSFAVAVALTITGVALYVTKFTKPKTQNISSKLAVIIGIAQGFAVAPGISRSGFTISAGMVAGLDKEKAARFSFLLSIPALIGAAAVEFAGETITPDFIGPTILGLTVSAIIGYLSIKFLLDIIRKGQFSLFAYYCWVIAAITVVSTIM